MSPTIINGREQTVIDYTDRGFSYGDGLFETLLVKQQQPQYWRQHMHRLQRGCEQLHLPQPNWHELDRQATKLCQTISESAVLKLVYTRGTGGRGYRMPELMQPTTVMALHPAPNYPDTHYQLGVRLKICATRLARQPILAGLKHLNRLEQVLASAEWQAAEYAEGLMLDYDDNIIEGTMSNVFLVSQGRLMTPSIEACGVAGIMREIIIEQAGKHNLEVMIRPISLDEVFKADEIFICNSVIGIWPVHQIEAKIFAIGPVTRHIQQWVA